MALEARRVLPLLLRCTSNDTVNASVYRLDLFDWSVPTEQCKTTKGSVRVPNGLKRQNSGAQGAKVTVNETYIVLFRVQTQVYAINERCPHAGECTPSMVRFHSQLVVISDITRLMMYNGELIEL